MHINELGMVPINACIGESITHWLVNCICGIYSSIGGLGNTEYTGNNVSIVTPAACKHLKPLLFIKVGTHGPHSCFYKGEEGQKTALCEQNWGFGSERSWLDQIWTEGCLGSCLRPGRDVEYRNLSAAVNRIVILSWYRMHTPRAMHHLHGENHVLWHSREWDLTSMANYPHKTYWYRRSVDTLRVTLQMTLLYLGGATFHCFVR